jgi:hypothetical protein
MNDAPQPNPDDRSLPVLAHPQAAEEVGNALRERVAASLDNTGKALAVLAGFGAFFFGAGYFVEWQRYKKGGLPPEEILPLVPTSQIAAAGVRELVISLLFVGLTLALLGFVFVRVARWSQRGKSRLARALNGVLASDVVLPTAVVGVLTLLIVPAKAGGVLIAAVLAGLLYYGLSLVRRFLQADEETRFPLWRLALAVAIAAVVLSGARQAEFQERRPDAVVMLTNGEELEADYIASDSGKILLRLGPADCEAQCRLSPDRCPGDCSRPRLIVIRSSEVREMRVTKASKLIPHEHGSLLEELFGIPLTCIPPECRWDRDERRIGPSSFL